LNVDDLLLNIETLVALLIDIDENSVGFDNDVELVELYKYIVAEPVIVVGTTADNIPPKMITF
jgi:hypothetical protein